jgi:hypothetical protein
MTATHTTICTRRLRQATAADEHDLAQGCNHVGRSRLSPRLAAPCPAALHMETRLHASRVICPRFAIAAQSMIHQRTKIASMRWARCTAFSVCDGLHAAGRLARESAR